MRVEEVGAVGLGESNTVAGQTRVVVHLGDGAVDHCVDQIALGSNDVDTFVQTRTACLLPSVAEAAASLNREDLDGRNTERLQRRNETKRLSSGEVDCLRLVQATCGLEIAERNGGCDPEHTVSTTLYFDSVVDQGLLYETHGITALSARWQPVDIELSQRSRCGGRSHWCGNGSRRYDRGCNT